MKITGFMHVAQLGNWRSVLDEQIALIQRTGLDGKCQSIKVGILGEEQVTLPKPFHLLYQSPNLSFYEYETLKSVWDFSQKEKGALWYIHTKGVSKTEKDWNEYKDIYTKILKVNSLEKLQKHEKQWRHYMQFYVIKKHELCMKAMIDFDLVGVCWREKTVPHFSGNFWWAATDYVKNLESPYNFASYDGVIKTNRGGAEQWIGSGTPSVLSLSNLHQNMYRWGVNPKEYTPIHL